MIFPPLHPFLNAPTPLTPSSPPLLNSMTVTAVIGAQWGDEGKGKITDYMAEQADYVVRFQGGNNAGHTIKVAGATYKLHLLPSGIVRPDKVAVIGNGLVVDPRVLLAELEQLKEVTGGRHGELKLSDRAHVIMPYHLLLDRAEEAFKGRDAAAGTTRKGIGPCYSDRTARFGIRGCDLLEPEALRPRLELALRRAEASLAALGSGELIKELSFEDIHLEYLALGQKLKPHVVDVSVLLHRALGQGRRILLEGAQGVHLDIEHGTYPYCTSSSIVSGNAACGSGLPPTAISRIMGVVKAYTTRVGTGPFPTELDDDIGRYLGEKGGEFGTTTGRSRRCGWLDLVLLRHSQRLCGFTGLAVTKLDVLGGLDELKVAADYRGPDGETVHDLPASMAYLERCEPLYETLPCWPDLDDREWAEAVEQGWDGLPATCLGYLEYLEQKLGVPVELASVGPGRSATVVRAV